MDEALLYGFAELVQEVELACQSLLLSFVGRGFHGGGVLEEAIQCLFPLVLREQAIDVYSLLYLAVSEAVFVPFGFLEAGLQFFVLH